MRETNEPMTRDELIALAAESGLRLDPEDIEGHEPGSLHIDGRPAKLWIDVMTMR